MKCCGFLSVASNCYGINVGNGLSVDKKISNKLEINGIFKPTRRQKLAVEKHIKEQF